MDLQHLSRARIVLLIATLFIVTGGLSIVLLKNYRAFQSGARSSSPVSTRATSKKAIDDQFDDTVTQTNSYTIKSGMITFSYSVDWIVNETEVSDAQKWWFRMNSAIRSRFSRLTSLGSVALARRRYICCDQK